MPWNFIVYNTTTHHGMVALKQEHNTINVAGMAGVGHNYGALDELAWTP